MNRSRGKVDRFGRMAVGQKVRFERLEMPPNSYPDGWSMELVRADMQVCIEQRAEIIEIRLGEVDAFVTLRTDGGQVFTRTFHWWGVVAGGSSSLTVLKEPPIQQALPLRAATSP